MENKQPIVFVPRALKLLDGEGQLTHQTFGWFVSKAYLKSVTTEYTTKGEIKTNYVVNFCPQIHDWEEDVSILVENGDNVSEHKIFKDYKSCKQYVNKLNKDKDNLLIKQNLECFECPIYNSEYLREQIRKSFKEVMSYANYLEDKYISTDEKQLSPDKSL